MDKTVQNVGDAPGLRGSQQDRVQVAQTRHLAVLTGVYRVIQTGIVVGNALVTVRYNDGFVQKLALFVVQIRNQQRKENVQFLDFGG